ncbi:MAG: hypothetical protein A2W36_03670 [Chloroflexi bacterium RBG_16_58_14]|nr:MAG: hypothetical protein A2W36_03670 [Chloroflexi bacterium RBG_16_58_14]
MPHPLVSQLRFTRSEFLRGVEGVSDEEGSQRFLPMNCISWNVGHLTWQEQRYFLLFGQGQLLFPDIHQNFAYGAPASTPSLKEMVAAWKKVTQAADAWLDTLTIAKLQENPIVSGKPIARCFGDQLQRTIYHYWYHTGENMAIRQQLGHSQLPEYVGDIDAKAPYRPEEP